VEEASTAAELPFGGGGGNKIPCTNAEVQSITTTQTTLKMQE
jgi:hypothetical protein